MPRVRRGPSGPKKSLAGRKGTNRMAKAPKGSSGPGKSAESYIASKGTGGSYGGSGGGY